jgi:ferrochelatase
MPSEHSPYDAVLVISFGGPEKPEDVMAFLENVTRGRNVPYERLMEVAGHYQHFGGKSPINDQCRQFIDALNKELEEHEVKLPVYWGNRNWHPFLSDTVRTMREDGVRHALAFVTSAYSSYSGCRQYLEDISAAQASVGEGAPRIDKLRVFYNHPHFIDALADRLREALAKFTRETKVYVIYTAHSIPVSMARTSDYQRQLEETSRLLSEAVAVSHYKLVFQSRSGPPNQPWLEPDILEYLGRIRELGIRNVVVAPIGFFSDHMEVIHDLDLEAKDLAIELGITMVRAQTVGVHPTFVRMVRELIEERLNNQAPKLAVGPYGPNHDTCPGDCCPASERPRRQSVSASPR